jgi:16S rRNA (cytidine1402-2'-O)-methyltransferase
MVFFEAPSRVAASLREMTRVFGADRPAAVCRELTKLHEQVQRAPLAQLADWAAAGVRGEIVVVVGGASPRRTPFADAVEQVRELTGSGVRLKDAAAEVAEATGHSRRDLYQAALTAKNG